MITPVLAGRTADDPPWKDKDIYIYIYVKRDFMKSIWTIAPT